MSKYHYTESQGFNIRTLRGHKHSVHNSYEYRIIEKTEMYETVNVYLSWNTDYHNNKNWLFGDMLMF